MAARKPNSTSHPAERFNAPRGIEGGVPLAHVIGPPLVSLLSESLANVHRQFDAKRFTRTALQDLDALGIMQRGVAIAHALAQELPSDFDVAAKILIASLGPELQTTEKNGLKVFFYLPHSQFIAHYGAKHFEPAMQACYELTKRFTAEFCIRGLLVEHETKSLKRLRTWATDVNPHVRRLVSEGSRPRLPWGIRLPSFQRNPQSTLKLLELLKDDPVRYVQRSVANHLGDVLKDNPDAGYEVCERWIDEASENRAEPELRKSRQWIVRHAVRLPAKKGDIRALRIRKMAKGI